MLRRVGPDLFDAPAGEINQIVAVAQNNNGVEAGTFRYPTPLPPQQILGHPGCTIVVVQLVTMFGCLVVFDSPAPPNARYDLFQVVNGNLVPLGISTVPSAGPLMGFRIRGVAVAVLAGAPPQPPPAPVPAPATARAVRRPTPTPQKGKRALKRKPARKRKAAPKRKRAATRQSGRSKRKTVERKIRKPQRSARKQAARKRR